MDHSVGRVEGRWGWKVGGVGNGVGRIGRKEGGIGG